MATEDTAVRRETILTVDRETAWEALCDAEGLETWLADEVDLDVRPGAEGTVRFADGEQRDAVVEEVVEGRRLALRWAEPGGEESVVDITLDDVPEGTRVVVVELPVTVLAEVPASVWGPQMVAAVA